MDTTPLLQPTCAIACAAGRAIMEIYARPGGVTADRKADDSPVTEADRQSSDLICKALAHLTPDIPVISEENPLPPYRSRRSWPHAWIVDPLDGTKEFLARNGDFTVNIALVEQGHPILGVIYLPAHDELYWAAKGQGAWKETAARPPQRIRAASFRLTDPGLRVPVSRSHLDPETKAFIATLREPIVVPVGGSVKHTMLAQGLMHFYPRLGPTAEWDTAAPQILLEEAGGQLLDWHTSLPLHYNKPKMMNPWFMATGHVLAWR